MAESLQIADRAVLALAQNLDTSLYNFASWDVSNELDSNSGSQPLLFPTGAYAARLWQPGDDIHLVFMTSNSPGVFWSMAFEKLGIEDLKIKVIAACLQIPDFCISDEGAMLSQLKDTRFYLHHCPFPQNFDLSLVEQYGFPRPSQNTNSAPETKELQLLHGAWHMSRSRTDNAPQNTNEQFEAAYFLVRSWAIAVGVFSKRFGYLNSDDLVDLVWKLFQDWKRDLENNAGTFLSYFFTNASDYLQINASLCRTTSHSNQQTTNESIRSSPLNSINAESGMCILDGLNMVKSETNIDHAIRITPAEGFRRFIDNSPYFLKFDASCWLQSPKTREEFGASLVSMLENIMFLIRQYNSSDEPRQLARIWPQPIVNDDNIPYITWTYILGVEWIGRETQMASIQEFDDLAMFLNKSIHFDHKSAYISVSAATGEDIHKMPSPLANLENGSQSSNEQIGQQDVESAQSKPTKFRTASSALSRLRFDPGHTRFEYEVGYLDRFEGLKWLALQQWGQKATEEEDFIPMHRVQTLRRLDDGFIVWDRSTRVDLTDQAT